ncbi:MAG TPA: 5-oxoprolinase subunit PxpA [Bryobacteraceae bacterium]|nr:5-oxoprolinase subunit PxpA [Bryobacteraceae bacterium]
MIIDLNSDMGELADTALEQRIMAHVTSANVACGAHAGDEATMERTIRLALDAGVAVGAHPGYPDRANFGRVEIPLTRADLERTVYEQVTALAAVADRLGARLVHVKPHGALYNLAAKDRDVARAVARGVARWSTEVVLVGLAGSEMLEVWRGMGFPVAAEAFADRRYEPDGSLRSRRLPDALITDPAEAGAQAVRLAASARTLCIHGDTPGAPQIAAAVREALRTVGIAFAPLSK